MAVTRPITPDLRNKIESVLEAANPWKRFENLEDDNRHSENVIHMAKHVGDEDVKKAKAIFARHTREGYLSDENGADRKVLHDKLWPKFRDKFAPKKN